MAQFQRDLFTQLPASTTVVQHEHALEKAHPTLPLRFHLLWFHMADTFRKSRLQRPLTFLAALTVTYAQALVTAQLLDAFYVHLMLILNVCCRNSSRVCKRLIACGSHRILNLRFDADIRALGQVLSFTIAEN
jgi:hypothetical protein